MVSKDAVLRGDLPTPTVIKDEQSVFDRCLKFGKIAAFVNLVEDLGNGGRWIARYQIFDGTVQRAKA